MQFYVSVLGHSFTKSPGKSLDSCTNKENHHKYHMPTEVRGDSRWDWWCLSDILKWWITLDNILNKTKYNHCSIHKKVSVLENSVYNKTLKYWTLAITCKIELYELQNIFNLFFILLGNLKLVQDVLPSPTTFLINGTTKPPKHSGTPSPINRWSKTPPPEVDTWNHG